MNACPTCQNVCTQVPKHVILADLPRYAATAFTVISFCHLFSGFEYAPVRIP